MSDQITREELDSMSQEDILQAEADGRLRALLTGQDPASTPPRDGGAAQLTREDLASMTPAEIAEAEAAGRFDVLMGVRPADDEGADDGAA